MSDYTISLVPRVSRYAFAEIAVDDILKWLVSKDIVKAELSECTLGNLGYAFSDGAQYIVLEPHLLPYQLDINGLEITTERTIFNTGQNGIDRIVCPNCTENIVDNEWDLDPWYKGFTDNLLCPICGTESDIHQYVFEPQWGFSNLGFTFWNWPELKPEFIVELQEKLNCDLEVVGSHI
ncbi:hypothetical protein [Sphingobacterium sp.]|uniref:hypothetical protein n=1 Tax=Sphingobacterium sp. TaxID=341027 RepID=UPI0031D32E70